ncbi:MAG: 50S ribosomal protein L5 [Candidatus Saganbacteria bacterium]|nr:50S ribosomal protein L5 [Candidatus Saganbacteria bacterium]
MKKEIALKEKYENIIVPALVKQFGYSNKMAVPKVKKVVLSCGVSEGTVNAKATQIALEELKQITGQAAAIRYAKKAIAGFKLKKNDPIGGMVTLRGEKMYLFLNKLIGICLPRVRDFRGLNPKSFDGRGSYSFGIKEQLIFPEIDYDRVDKTRGMNITIVTSANTDKEARALFEAMGIPFIK